MRLQIRSADRVNPTTSTSDSFVVNLPFDLVGRYTLATVVIPNSIYNITSINNKIYINGTTVSLTAGYYTYTDLATHVQARLIAVLGDASFTCTYSTTTSKFTIANGTTFQLTWASSTGDDCAAQLGWSLANTTTAGTQTSTNVASIIQTTGIMVQIDEITSREHISSNQKSNVAFYVPLTEAFGSYVVWTPTTCNCQYLHFANPIKQLKISLFTEDHKPLSLNGLNWSFVLQQ